MWIEDWRQSGKSAWAYAKENGLNPQTFANWTKAKHEPKERACFVEVAARIIPQPMQMPEILIEKGGMKIHIPLNIGREELCTVMEGLRCGL